MFGCAEFPRFPAVRHISENFRIENLYPGKHQFTNRAVRLDRRFAVEKPADSTARIDVHGAVFVGALVSAQHQGRRRIPLHVEADERRQIQIDQRVCVDDDEGAVLQECFRLEQPAAGVEQFLLSRIADLEAQGSAVLQAVLDLLAEVMQVDDNVLDAVVAQQ